MNDRAQTIAISGSSGLVGSAIAAKLSSEGRTVIPLVRGAARAGAIAYDIDAGTVDEAALAEVDAIIHLAGENVGARWTDERKRRILHSWVASTELLARAIARLDRKPSLLCASAIGIYGYDRGDTWLDESTESGDGFLAEVCRAWEAAAEPARAAGARTAHLRIGVVLSAKGGALDKLLPVFRLGAGGKVGSGEQFMSWVALEDVVRAFVFALDRPDLSGPINIVAPEPVTNAAFTQALAHALHRPAIVPVPALALKLAMGEMARETVLASQRVAPKRLQAAGFTFSYPTIDAGVASAIA